MSHLETSSRKKRHRKDITSFVLKAVGGAGVLGAALVAPNVIGAMSKLGMIPNVRQKEIINRARGRLLKRDLLKRNNKGMLELTQKGKMVFAGLQARDAIKDRAWRWDRRWRILIFDIPEYRRQVRDRIRHTLADIGFLRLQDSVWIYPYDCEEFVALLKADFKIGKDLLYLIVEEIEGERYIKDFFSLH